MEQKARIFIGSSSEGLKVAEWLQKELGATFEVVVWTDGRFTYNQSAFEILIKEAKFFDYGIMVATKDDFTESRGEQFDSARDNVVFEFGLFLGAMGPSRAFLIKEEGCKLPSDLFGITLPSFSNADAFDESQELETFAKRVASIIEENERKGQIGFFPSTALATGYFENFLAPLCESLYESGGITFSGRQYKEFMVNIVLPDEIDSDIKKSAMVFYKDQQLSEFPVKTGKRSFPVHVKSDLGSGKLLIYDIPTTLNDIKRAVEMFLKKDYVGETSEQASLEARELRNFYKTLSFLVKTDKYTKQLVDVFTAQA